MKSGIHPEYNELEVTCTSCGNKFKTGSTLKELRVDVCSKCHPFYTGDNKFGSAKGRVDRFNTKYNLKKK